MAFYLGDKHDWIDFEKSMEGSMLMARKVKKGEASLIDFEDVGKIEKERPQLKNITGTLLMMPALGRWRCSSIDPKVEE